MYTGCENVRKMDSTEKHFEIIENLEQVKDERIKAFAWIVGGIFALVIVFGIIVPLFV